MKPNRTVDKRARARRTDVERNVSGITIFLVAGARVEEVDSDGDGVLLDDPFSVKTFHSEFTDTRTRGFLVVDFRAAIQT